MDVLILDEGSPGHFAQSAGVIDLLTRHGVNAHVTRHSVQNKLPGIFRGGMRFFVNISPQCFLSFLYRCCYGGIPPHHKVDLIISSGGKSAFASYLLARLYNARAIFVGVPEPYPDAWFDLIVSPVTRQFSVPYIVTGVIPNKMTPAVLAKVDSDLLSQVKSEGPCWSLMIGGSSKSHHFNEADWQGLIAGINYWGAKGVQWLITTSRRTPSEVEYLIAAGVESRYIQKLVLYNRQPEKVMVLFLAASDRAFVSQDSLTMASEALCSGRPVTLLAPSKVVLQSGSFFEEIINTFPTLPGVTRVPMAELSNVVGTELHSALGDETVEIPVISLDSAFPALKFHLDSWFEQVN